MKESKLLNTILIFSDEELEKLRHFLDAPDYKNEKHYVEIVGLFEHVRKYSNSLEKVNIDKDYVYGLLFPDSPQIKGKLDKLMSTLLKQVYAFIETNYRFDKGDSIQGMITLVNFFHLRQEKNKEDRLLTKAKKLYNDLPQKDILSFYKGFLISQQEIRKDYILQDKKNNTVDFDSVLEPLDVYYLLNKLEYACFFLSMDRYRKPIKKIESVINTIENLKSNFKNSPILKIPLIRVYFQAYDLLKDNKEEDYWKLRILLEEMEEGLSSDKIRTFMSIVRNFVVRQYILGGHHMLKEFFKLNKFHLERGYLNIDKGIIPSSFTNMVNIGLRSKEFNWVHKFLNDYKNKIVGAEKPEDIYHLNLAAYHFSTEKYDLALSLLQEQYEDVFYKILARRLELKIFFETKMPILESRMDAYKIYIYRLPKSEILDRQRSKENNFINFLRRLNNPKTVFSSERIEKLISKIYSTNLLSERIWLLEKLEILKMKNI